MKKNNRIWIYPLMVMGVFILFTSSCKKGDDINKSSANINSVKKLQTVHYSSGSTTTYEYNSDGKVSKSIDTGDGVHGGGYTFTYTYSGNIITTTTVEPTGRITNEVSTLNSQGYISKTTGTRGSQNYAITYEYDNSGYCIKEIFSESNSNQITTYIYTNGNKTSSTYTEGTYTSLVTYEYYLDKENTLSDEHLFGMSYRGKSSKNLIKKETYPPSNTSFTAYTYDYDQDNYVTKLTNTYNDGTTYWETYSYK